MSGGSFALDLSRFVAKAKGRTDLVVRKVCFDLFKRVVMRTPVDTGRLRGNWMCSVNEYTTESPFSGGSGRRVGEDLAPRGNASSAAQASLDRITKTTADVHAGQVIYLTNSLPYVMEIEHGKSKQAPSGMLLVSVQEFPDVVALNAGSVQTS